MIMKMRSKIIALLASVLLLSSGAVAAEEFWQWAISYTRTKGVQPVTNKKYLEECGSCHFAYQPGLLPAKSWEKLLNDKALVDHFGDNAELDKETLKDIHDYAIENASGTSYFKTARKITISTENGEAPLRIIETRYIKRKHHELKDEMVKGNKDVKSLSNCNACHTQADKGVFDDDTVSIPNFKDWD
jgi:cytochrome c553